MDFIVRAIWRPLVCAACVAAVTVVIGIGTADAQQDAAGPGSFVPGPGTVGRFEASDPVLNDEVATGVIPDQQDWYLFGPPDRRSIRGWLDGGFVGNFGYPPSKFNGPYNAVDRANEAMANQVYLIGEQVLPTDGSTGIGGRVDLLYGEDFLLAQSQGWEFSPSGAGNWNSGEYYGLALPQLYAEAGNEDLSVKLGHFYTIVGYEGVPAVGNFFYMKSYSYQFAGPFTEWGGLAHWRARDNVDVDAGCVNGWNNLSSPYSGPSFLGRVRVRNDDNSLATTVAVITGNEATDPAPSVLPIPLVAANRTRYSWIVEARPAANWEYVFHQWLGTENNGTVQGNTAFWTGIDQYLYYRYSEQWRWGARFEWFQDADGVRVGLNRPSNPNKVPLPGNYYSLTVGPNWLPQANWLVRPALRWDFYGGSASPFNDGTSTSQLLLGFDGIMRF